MQEVAPELELAGYRPAERGDGARCCSTCNHYLKRNGQFVCAHCYCDEVLGHFVCDYYEYNGQMLISDFQKYYELRQKEG
jgi:hypothetical protein